MKKSILVLLIIATTVAVSFSQTTETIKKYHDPYSQTQLSEVYSVIVGTPTKHGSYKSYDAKGHLTQTGSYSNGKQTGEWTTYYGTALASLHNDGKNYLGKVKEIVQYKNGLRDGQRVAYSYPDGVKTIEYDRIYSEGEIIKETVYWEDGTKKSIAQLGGLNTVWNERGIKILEFYLNKSNEEEGVYKQWYDDGSKFTESNYKNGDLIGEAWQWFSNGEVQIQRTYNESSIIVKNYEYYPSGQLKTKFECTNLNCSEITYDSITGNKSHEASFLIIEDNGRTRVVKNGTETIYHENGQIEEKGENLNNEKTGEWNYYYDSGAKFQYAVFVKGVLQGDYFQWYESEKIKEEGHYENGRQSGLWKFYYENGQLRSKGVYSAYEQPVGKWEYFKEDGSIDYVEETTNGIRIKKSGEQIQGEELKSKVEILNKKNKEIETLYEVYEKEDLNLDSWGSNKTETKKEAKNKRHLYQAYKIVESSYDQQINGANSNAEKLKGMEAKLRLADRLIELYQQDTKELEKELKKQDNGQEIKKLLGL